MTRWIQQLAARSPRCSQQRPDGEPNEEELEFRKERFSKARDCLITTGLVMEGDIREIGRRRKLWIWKPTVQRGQESDQSMSLEQSNAIGNLGRDPETPSYLTVAQ